MISYEISIGFSVLTVVICSGSFSLSTVVIAQQKIWFIVPLLPVCIVFYISMLAETNRHPFDLPEAEAELYERMCLMWSYPKVIFFRKWVYGSAIFSEIFHRSIMCVLAYINLLFKFVDYKIDYIILYFILWKKASFR